MIHRVYNKLKRILNPPPQKFDANGERVDIFYNNKIDFDLLDIYQKSHYRRYEFAVNKTNNNEIVGDLACGTGYGSVMLSNKAKKVIGADINGEVISAIKKRYSSINNIKFVNADLLDLKFLSFFDTIISFETIEHFSEKNIELLLSIFYKSMKPNGKLIFSTPYMQEKSEAALELGHHLTFYINEQKIEKWLAEVGFIVELYNYQNYETHSLQTVIKKKDFIICEARKK